MAWEVGIDVSDYQPVLKEKELEGNIDFLIAKAVEVDDRVFDGWNSKSSVDMFCEETLSNKVQVAYNLRIPCGVYIFDNPSYKMQWKTEVDILKDDQDPQTRSLVQALDHKLYHAIIVDAERWWLWYNEYLRALNNTFDMGKVQKIQDSWIRISTECLVNRILRLQKVGNLRPVPVWVYYGRWFVTGYAPSLDPYLAHQIQWGVAGRVHNPPEATDYAGYMPNSVATGFKTWKDMRDYIQGTSHMGLPAWTGNKLMEMQQVTDKFRGPGLGVYQKDGITPAGIDVNRVIGENMSVLFDMANVPQTPPEPTPDPNPNPTPEPTPKTYATVNQTLLNVRTGAGTTYPNIPNQVEKGTVLEVLDKATDPAGNTWVKVAINGWIAAKYNGADYCTLETK